MGGQKYRFRPLGEGPHLAGVTQVINDEDQTILLLDFNCYARLMDDGICLLWWEEGSKETRSIEFRIFPFNKLRPIEDANSAAKEMRERKDHSTELPAPTILSIPCWLSEGIHAVNAPDEFHPFQETLVLAEYQAGSNSWDKMYCAIFVFDWINGQVRIIPQDWFNNGSYDFGYQWIARVARTTNESIVGDGIRLGSFELDESGRQVKRWLSKNDFHMIT